MPGLGPWMPEGFKVIPTSESVFAVVGMGGPNADHPIGVVYKTTRVLSPARGRSLPVAI
jgi:hypothetical protein